jgi:hypothetical protein
MPNSSPLSSQGLSPQVQRKRPPLSQEERLSRNVERLQQYGSQVVVPRAPETRVMIRMVYPLNKALAKLRRLVGMPLSVAAVMRAIQPIRDWQERATVWLKESGGDFILTAGVLGNSAAERRQLVQHRDAHVIVPQTDEARQVIETLIRMDQVLLMLRLISLDTIEKDGRLRRALELARGLNGAVAAVCESAKVEYQEPKGLHRTADTESDKEKQAPALVSPNGRPPAVDVVR